MNPHLPSIASSELLILIRGGKHTGKTSLLKRMSGRPFKEEYEASTITQTTTIKWKPVNRPSSIVSITLLDVVSMNPRLTTTAHGTPHGIIVIYDPRDSESVTYAVQVIENTPPSIPVALLTNFQDHITCDLHPLLRSFTNRAYSICSSMATNLGLAELSHWLELPLSLNVYSAYSKLLNHSNKEIERLKSMFAPGNQNRIINMSAQKNEDDEFWSDDERFGSIQMFGKPKNQPQNNSNIKNGKNNNNNAYGINLNNISFLPEIQQVPELTEQNGPIDKDDELMQAIIQTAASSRTVIGKDEIDYDKLAKRNLSKSSLNNNNNNSQQQPPISIQQQMQFQMQQQQQEKKKHHRSKNNSGEKKRHHHSRSSKNKEVDISAIINAQPQLPQFPPQIPQPLPQSLMSTNPKLHQASSQQFSQQTQKLPQIQQRQQQTQLPVQLRQVTTLQQQMQLQAQLQGRRDNVPLTSPTNQVVYQATAEQQRTVTQPQPRNDYDTI